MARPTLRAQFWAAFLSVFSANIPSPFSASSPGLLREEVVRGQPDEIPDVLVGIPIPAPHRAFDPEPQVLGAEQRIVQRAGLLPGLRLGQDFPPVLLAEEPTLALAEYFGMGV